MKITIIISVFIILTFSSLALSSCATTKNAAKPVNEKNPHETKIIHVSGGDIQGIWNKDKSVEIFAGIPFAAPPVGDLRWKEPQDVIPWEGVYKADHFAPMAMQNQLGRFLNFLYNAYTHQKKSRTYKAPMSEDCLYLNVWKPADSKASEPLPVLVYIHGGSLNSGQSWYESYDGENLAKEGIIVVTIAYRVGIFGYLADSELREESPHGTTGNYGLLDQIKALDWVRKNIRAFWGDENNITIAGESAGSSSVNALCASPLTKGTFRRAIAESSSIVEETPPHTFRTMEAALKMGEDVKAEFGVKSIEELRKIPAKKLLKSRYDHNSMTVDGYALVEKPYETYRKGLNHEEALLNGFNKNEGAAFTFFTKVTAKSLPEMMRPTFKDRTEEFFEKYPVKNDREAKTLYNDIFSAWCFTKPHDKWTKTVAAQGRPVWEYYFSRENGSIGSNHSGEMIYAYRNVPRNKYYSEKDFEIEEIMSSYWINFVKTGNPNGNDTLGRELPMWEESAASGGLLLEIGDECRMREDPFRGFYKFLK
ncbi:carboxylesterase/lipase family protein [Treponema sp. C6A8]|uniref:carboxylesterase/lipase family protein n=1 Tax=Treponema sp. C6A8 TaxID=1410609 RepID=UPI000688C3CF|nr:carboxylesterase family protein [Treponema sp. C6A8]